MSTATTLAWSVDAAIIEPPPLPPRGRKRWHPLVERWWQSTWKSPMASEYIEADVPGLYVLAELYDRFFKNPTPALAAEIRLQRACYGQTPIDRRRLQWEIAKVDDARRPAQPSRQRTIGDPRALLHAS